MTKLGVVGASGIALSAALGIGTAVAVPSASRVLTVHPADYNAAQVKTAGDLLTVPDGLAIYHVNSGTLEINSRFTVTLPTGFTFSSQPALSDNGSAIFTLASGGIGSQTITFMVTGEPVVAPETVTLGTFAVQGATALETPIPVAAALPITVQSTNNSQVNNNDPHPLSGGAFASEPGATAPFVGAVQRVDLTSPVLGTEFGTSPAHDSTTALLSAMVISAETSVDGVAVLSPDGAPNTLSTSDTATVTVSGLFNGITAAFSSTTSDCAHSEATGTVALGSITIPDVPLNKEVFFCVTADGTTLLSQNLPGFQVTMAPGTSTDFLSGPVRNEFPGLWTYFGGGVISVTNFFTGDDSGYSSLLRVNNAGNGQVNLFALVQPDTGGAPLSGSLGPLAASTGTVFTEPQLAAAVSGLALANSGQRATVQLIINGDFGAVAASSFLVNPGGVVDNVGVRHLEESASQGYYPRARTGRSDVRPEAPMSPPSSVRLQRGQ